MGDAHTRPLGAQQKAQTLALADLRTVKWVASQTLVKEAYNVGKPRYLALKQAAIVGWVVVFYEMVLVWWWTFAHNLPWPTPVLAGLTQLDLMVVRLLDFTQQRLEWWWDAWGVRLMWIRETLLARLDRYITIIDRYLLRVQDVLAAILTLLITPLSIVFEYLNVTPKVVQKPGRANDDQGQGRAVGGAHDDDGDEDEEWGDDNLSDASTDSKLLLKNDPQGNSWTTSALAVIGGSFDWINIWQMRVACALSNSPLTKFTGSPAVVRPSNNCVRHLACSFQVRIHAPRLPIRESNPLESFLTRMHLKNSSLKEI